MQALFFVTLRPQTSLHPVGPPRIQIVSNDFFNELPAAQGTLEGALEDLRQTDLHLPDGQIPLVTGLSLSQTQR